MLEWQGIWQHLPTGGQKLWPKLTATSSSSTSRWRHGKETMWNPLKYSASPVPGSRWNLQICIDLQSSKGLQARSCDTGRMLSLAVSQIPSSAMWFRRSCCFPWRFIRGSIQAFISTKIRKWAAKKVDLVDAAHKKRTPTAAKMLLLVLSTQNFDRAGPHGTIAHLSELAADSIWATWNLFFESPQTLA